MFPMAPAVNPAAVVGVEALAATVLFVAGAAVLQLVGAVTLAGIVNAVAPLVVAYQ
jgi:hypothetical protein